MPDLYQELSKLADSDYYPFHMPGHKRNVESTPMKGAFRCDITEIDDFDNLHDASGIIQEAQNRAGKLYGCKETFFLVNGSTCGILTALSAAFKEGDTILAARGCHKAFYHGAYLRHINIEYLPYKLNERYGIPESYTGEDIEKALSDGIKGVFITSPTYEGRCSDIGKIAQICHRRNIPLIVDAAHGAHFGFGNNVDGSGSDCEYEKLPENAIKLGADVVIHSVHKTLPSMTQTALLHCQGNTVDVDRIRRYLRIYQSSSPSYVLMASIDLCIKEMEQEGTEFVRTLLEYRNHIQNAVMNCKNLEVLGKNVVDDAAKVCIYVKNGTMTGQKLYDILREEYHLQLEMAGDRHVLAIISGWDTLEGIDRLINAIIDIDSKIGIVGDASECISDNTKDGFIEYQLPKRVIGLNEAWDSDREVISFDEALGHVSGEFVNLYPPGIPLVVPGEEINSDIVRSVAKYLDENMNVQGIVNGDRKGFICVKQK